MSPSPTATPRAPQLVERFVKQLNIAYKAVKLYPIKSEIPQDSARSAVEVLRLIVQRTPVMQLTVQKEGLLCEGAAIFPESSAFAAFAKEFYTRNLAEVRFHAGCTPDECLQFLSVLDIPPDELMTSGGFEAHLWELGVDSVTVTEVSTRIVEHEFTEVEGEGVPSIIDGEPWPPEIDRISEILAGANAGRPRDQRLLVRVIRDTSILAGYLQESSSSRGKVPSDSEMAARVAAMARVVQYELPEDQETLLRSIADAIMELEPDMRAQLVRSRLLEEARLDDMLGEVVRQMSLDELFDSILHDMEDSPASRAGLARAIRNLALINISSSRETMLQAAGAAMRSRGASEEMVASVMDSVSPHKLEVSAKVRTSEAKPVENILRLIDLAPERGPVYAYTEDVADLRAEAARGITDGDVLAALVALAVLDTREQQFASIMALLEDSIGLLVDLQEFEVAADAAEALTAADDDPALSDGQRRRIREVLKVLSKPDSMKKITAALRVYRHDSPEYAACRRLLGLLGEHTISSLLEVLAQEQDMQARKAIVDLVSGMAERFIPELGRRVTDHRWYFVRNVVAILATTRDPKVIPYLQRTIRHSDERVRRETIRALAAVRDALADEMLVSALQDDDGQNVQLAARYLGSLGVRGAAGPLEEVARGEGHGNRDSNVRIEAIEALGRLGAPSSIAVLQEIARPKGIMGGRRDKELRAAAEAAVGAVRAHRAKGAEA